MADSVASPSTPSRTPEELTRFRALEAGRRTPAIGSRGDALAPRGRNPSVETTPIDAAMLARAGAARVNTDDAQDAARRELTQNRRSTGAAGGSSGLATPTKANLAGAVADQVGLLGGALTGDDASRDALWQNAWTGMMVSLNAAFQATWMYVVPPLILGPLIVSLYLMRLVGVHLLGGGKPKHFPLFGIVEFQISPLRWPGEWLEAGMAIGAVLLLAFLFTFIMFVMLLTAGSLCHSLESLCKMVPHL